jgi:hypothetical protein
VTAFICDSYGGDRQKARSAVACRAVNATSEPRYALLRRSALPQRASHHTERQHERIIGSKDALGRLYHCVPGEHGCEDTCTIQ